jgi:hypothetical protein
LPESLKNGTMEHEFAPVTRDGVLLAIALLWLGQKMVAWA